MAFDIENENIVVILSNVSADHEHKRSIDQLNFELMKVLEE